MADFILTDDVTAAGAIASNPGTYTRYPQKLGGLHTALSGRRIWDHIGVQYTLVLQWNFSDDSQYEDLEAYLYSSSVLYFSDFDNPKSVESNTLASGGASENITMSDYYALDGDSDVVEVYNVTTTTVLVKDTTYTLNADKVTIAILNQSAADVIRVTYHAYFECVLVSLTNTFKGGDPDDGSRKKQLTAVLHTLTERIG
jgi:hypothetical protein